MVQLERQGSLNVLKLDAIINRQAEVVIVICISHILAVVHRIVAHRTAINHQAALLEVVKAVTVIVINQTQQTTHHIVAVLRRVQRQRRAHMILMMMDMMTYTWMEIMIGIDIAVILIMQTESMTLWMNLMRTGKNF